MEAFTTNLGQTIGELGGAIIVLGFLAGLYFGGLFIFRAGIKNREALERRGKLYDDVEKYRQAEEFELAEIRKRRAELGKPEK